MEDERKFGLHKLSFRKSQTDGEVRKGTWVVSESGGVGKRAGVMMISNVCVFHVLFLFLPVGGTGKRKRYRSLWTL